jgi:type III restriction enzyme
VEYKGAHLIDSRETKEKNMVGGLWEKHSGGKGLFLMVEKSKDGLNVAEQMRRKTGGGVMG